MKRRRVAKASKSGGRRKPPPPVVRAPDEDEFWTPPPGSGVTAHREIPLARMSEDSGEFWEPAVPVAFCPYHCDYWLDDFQNLVHAWDCPWWANDGKMETPF